MTLEPLLTRAMASLFTVVFTVCERLVANRVDQTEDAQKTEMKRSFQTASKIPMQLISGGNALVTPNRHWKKDFPEALVELAQFVLFGQFDHEASHF